VLEVDAPIALAIAWTSFGPGCARDRCDALPGVHHRHDHLAVPGVDPLCSSAAAPRPATGSSASCAYNQLLSSLLTC
jgi:hypothetical protein